MTSATWQGTDRELARLRRAIARNCDCAVAMEDVPPQCCSVHAMLTRQRSLDRLLYVYRTRRVFIAREFYSLPSRSVTGVTAA
jgi:hypothetical protein